MALLHSTNLAALQAFGYQIYVQLLKPKLVTLASTPTGQAAPPPAEKK